MGNLATTDVQAPDFTVEEAGAYREQDLSKIPREGVAGQASACLWIPVGKRRGGAVGTEVLPSPPRPQYKVPLLSILGTGTTC